MVQRIKKQLFRILPLSVVGLMALVLVAGSWQILPIRAAKAAQASVTNADGLHAKPIIGVTHGCPLADKYCAKVKKIMHNFNIKIRGLQMIKKGPGINNFKIISLILSSKAVSSATMLAFFFLFTSSFQSLLFAMWMDIQDNERLYK